MSVGHPVRSVLRSDDQRQTVVVVHLGRVQSQTEGVLTGGVHNAPLVVEDLGCDPRVLQSLCQLSQLRVLGQR